MNSSAARTSTRAACDRCRAHKLRCVPDPTSLARPKHCTRCSAAHAACHYGSPGRPGRPPGKRPAVPPDARLDRPFQPPLNSTAKDHALSAAYQAHDDHVDSAAAQPLLQHLSDRASRTEYDEFTALLRAEFSPSYSVAANASDTQFPQGQPREDPIPQVNYRPSVRTRPHAEPEQLLTARQQRPDPEAAQWRGANSWFTGPRPEGAGSPIQGQIQTSDLQAASAQARSLSDLIATLRSTAEAGASRKWSLAAHEATSGVEELAVRVLDVSTAFQQLLQAMFTPSRPAGGSAGAEREAPYMSPISSGPSTTFDEGPQAATARRDESADGIDMVPRRLDTATCLQFLACYMQLVSLHRLFYSSIKAAMEGAERQADRVRPLFPGLSINGHSLDDYAKFQWQLLVSITSHALGRIETLLGLPTGSRVSRRPAGDGGVAGKGEQRCGVLEASVSLQLVRLAMQEDETTSGCNAVVEVKQLLAELRDSFTGAVDF